MTKFVKNILDYLFVILTIISCNSVYMNFIGTNSNKVIIISYCIVLFLSLLANGLKKKKIGSFLLFLFFYYCYLFVFNYFNDIGDNLFEFVSYFCVLIPAAVLYFLNLSKEEIKNKLIKLKNVIVILALYSIILYILTNLNIIINYEYKLVRWSLTESIPSVMNLYFMPQGKLRNSLFFTEPAMYSIFLVLAMSIERTDKNHKINNFILFVAILTTRSATGILLAFFVLIFDYIKFKRKGLLQILSPIIVIFCVIIAYNVFSQKTLSLSYQMRLDDYIACIKTWRSNPIFGTGFMNNKVIQSNMSFFRRSNQGLSNSLFVILAQGGIFLLTIYVFPLLHLLKRTIKKQEFLIVLVFLILLTTTIFHYTILAYSGIAIGFSSFLNNREFKKEE